MLSHEKVNIFLFVNCNFKNRFRHIILPKYPAYNLHNHVRENPSVIGWS